MTKPAVCQVNVAILNNDETPETEPPVEDKNANEILSILTMPDDVMLLIRSLKLKAGIGVQSAVDAIKKIDGVLLV